MDKLRHIAVEGPIGAGKTSLARRRAADYERGIGEDYLALLAEGYARFFYNYGAAPVLIVNSENLNFVARDADLELLLARMRGMKSRREFFSLC